MDILKRELAPISSDAWTLIEQQALVRLKGNLSARKHVGLSGPHGWNLGAVSLGRLRLMKSEPREGIHWGLREVLPLMEVRVPFFLKLMEIDSISRGLKNPDLGGLDEAAHRFHLSRLRGGRNRGNDCQEPARTHLAAEAG